MYITGNVKNIRFDEYFERLKMNFKTVNRMTTVRRIYKNTYF